jgi:adenine-specific DNA-methyltransferase
LLPSIDQTRLLISKNTESKKKSQFGQFLTSEKTAAFMANMFPPANGNCQLLDAGAGIGSLSAAFLDRHRSYQATAQQKNRSQLG